MEKGIRALLHHKVALQEASDVDALRTADGGTVGQGTRDKIKQIVALGYLPRNKELQSNVEHQCVQLVPWPSPRPPAHSRAGHGVAESALRTLLQVGVIFSYLPVAAQFSVGVFMVSFRKPPTGH